MTTHTPSNISLPLISIVIPVLNEVDNLPVSIDSLLNNNYSISKLEFIIVDGGSTDGTREYVQRMAKENPLVRLLDNPKRITPSALNIGIQNSTGDIILRADAHAFYYPGYIAKSVQTIVSGDADNVGGAVSVIGKDGVFSECIAIAMNSWLGSGGVSYRKGDKRQLVDTVWCGCWHKKTLNDIGGFNEEWTINQDYELNYRLRRSGKHILFCPEIKADYYCRNSFRSLMKQFFRYGGGRAKTLFYYPGSLKLRHLAALAPLSLLLLALISPLFSPLLITPFALYLLLVLSFASVTAIKKRKPLYLPVLIVTLLIMHLSWGMGLIISLSRLVGRKLIHSLR